MQNTSVHRIGTQVKRSRLSNRRIEPVFTVYRAPVHIPSYGRQIFFTGSQKILDWIKIKDHSLKFSSFLLKNYFVALAV